MTNTCVFFFFFFKFTVDYHLDGEKSKDYPISK